MRRKPSIKSAAPIAEHTAAFWRRECPLVVYAQAQRKGRDSRRSTQSIRVWNPEWPEEIYLAQYGLMAERHWREFRPKMVQRLERTGTLTEALFEAQERTIEEMEALTRKLETEQKLTPQQAHDRAWEMIREKYILLPPEEND